MRRANAINDEQKEHLRNLIDEGNSKLATVFRKYEADKDVYALIDSLREVELETKVRSIKKTNEMDTQILILIDSY